MTWTQGFLTVLVLILLDATALARARQAPTERDEARTPLEAGAARAPASARGDPGRLLEGLEAEERARSATRAATDAAAEEERLAREREQEEARWRDAAAALDAARALDRRREAMVEWHASFTATLDPVLRARGALYRKMPKRLFARVRPQCEAVANAAAGAAASYVPAPERRVDVLARDLLAVYRESARYCVGGLYFSFTVQEGTVRRLATELIAALEPFGLAFPRASPDARERAR